MISPYQSEVTCEVCGETGLAHVRDAGLSYLGVGFRHKNPQVCADNIKRHEDQKTSNQQKAQLVENGAGI